MKTKQEIFQYLVNLPSRITIPTRNKYDKPKKATTAFQDVVIASPITEFYRQMLAPKTTCIIPIPEIISISLYDKLARLIKRGEALNSLLFTRYFQVIQFLVLYEDYFGNLFKRDYVNNNFRNAHACVTDIDESKDIADIYKELYDNKHPLRHLEFFADCVDIVRIIEGKNK